MSGAYAYNFGEYMKDFPRGLTRTRVKKNSWFACWKLASYRGRRTTRKDGPKFYFCESAYKRARAVARETLKCQFLQVGVVTDKPALTPHSVIGGVSVFREAAL